MRLPEVFTHISSGEIEKGNSKGIHFFQTARHRIAEMIGPANEHGVWEARIDIRHPHTNAWVSKKRSSTLFPRQWTLDILTEKLEQAYVNQTPRIGHRRIGKTDCGMSIVFIFQEGKWMSCYPLYN